MRSLATAIAEGLQEAALVLTVLVVPLFVNYYSHSVFEQDKAGLMLAAASVAVVAGVVVFGERGIRAALSALRQPLVAVALTMLLAWTVAAVMGIDPSLAWRGSYERAQGLLTLTAYLGLFGAAAWLSRDVESRLRICAAVVWGSAPVAALSVLQRLGFEAVPGSAASPERVFGTLSNPIFLGTYLMLAALLAVGVAGEAWRRGHSLAAMGCLAIGGFNVIGLALSDSRGPMLGFGVGALCLMAAAAYASRRRLWSALALTVLVAGAAVLIVFNLEDSPLASLRTAPVVGRFGLIGQTESGSERTRTVIWQGASDLLEAETGRLVTGFGPESLKYVLLRHIGPSVGGREVGSLADRSHNVLFDALIMTGILGALATLGLYVAWAYSAAAAAGLPGRAIALGSIIGAGAGLLGWIARPAYGPALVLGGLGAGSLIALLLAGLARSDREAPGETGPETGLDESVESDARSGAPHGGSGFAWLGAALTAAAAAAAMEAAFGIVTVVTGAVTWVLAGVAAGAYASRRAGDGAAVTAPAALKVPAKGARSGEITLSWSWPAAAYGALAGATAGLAFYSLLAAPSDVRPDTALPVAVLVAAIIVMAGLLVNGLARNGALGYVLASTVALGAYLVIRAAVLASAGDAATLFAVTVWWLVALVIGAGLALRPRESRGLWRFPIATAYPIVAVVAVTAVQLYAVQPIRADIYFQSAIANFGLAFQADDTQAFQAAQTLFERSVRLNPRQPIYYLRWAELYTRLGEATGDPEAAAAAFQQAQSFLIEAETLDPNLPYYAFNRGHLQLIFARALPPDQQGMVAANAVAALEQAFAGAPTDLQVALELGQAHLLNNDLEAARNMADYVLGFEPGQVDALVLRGRAYAAEGNLAEAEAAYQSAITAGATSPEPYVALGEMARQAQDLMAARNWYGQAAEIDPNNWIVLYNLGLLHRDTGDIQQALPYLSRALNYAPPAERERVQAALESLATGQSTP